MAWVIWGEGISAFAVGRQDLAALNRLTDMAVTKGSGMLATFNYNPVDRPLGLSGNRMAAREVINAGTTINRSVNYYYDNRYRLAKEELVSGTKTGTVDYGPQTGNPGTGYDAVGNRRSRVVNVIPAVTGFGTVNATFNTKDWLTGSTYDLNGNTTLEAVPSNLAGTPVSPTTTADTYDFENHLIQRVGGGTTVQMVYDGDGNRLWKTVSAGTSTDTRYYLVDDRNASGYAQVVEELVTESGVITLSRVYTYGHSLVSQWQSGGSSGTTFYYGYDGHGNVRFLLDGTGAITDTYTYDAFGVLLDKTGSTANNYLYCGEQYDFELGTYYLRARYMNPGTGRFWTMDTFGGEQEDPLSLHKYLYCRGNPVDGIDPSGHGETVIEFNIAGALAASLAAFSIGVVWEARTHAIGNLIKAVATDAASIGDSFIEIAKSTIRSAGKTLEGLIEEAKSIANLRNLPVKVIPMPHFIIPAIASHITSAQTIKPSYLTRTTSAKAILNRAAAIAKIPRAGTGYSLDEYPFASSTQGGLGASVAAVPWWQNAVQGGIIGACYVTEKITPGTPYWVVVTP
jgi:RHS repeat-associated protein